MPAPSAAQAGATPTTFDLLVTNDESPVRDLFAIHRDDFHCWLARLDYRTKERRGKALGFSLGDYRIFTHILTSPFRQKMNFIVHVPDAEDVAQLRNWLSLATLEDIASKFGWHEKQRPGDEPLKEKVRVFKMYVDKLWNIWMGRKSPRDAGTMFLQRVREAFLSSVGRTGLMEARTWGIAEQKKKVAYMTRTSGVGKADKDEVERLQAEVKADKDEMERLQATVDAGKDKVEKLQAEVGTLKTILLHVGQGKQLTPEMLAGLTSGGPA